MADQEQLDDFLEALETVGSPAPNAQLREALGWPDDQYEAVKAELAARKIVVRGRGRSDTVSLVGAEPVLKPKGPSRNGQGMYPELFDKLRKLRNEMAHMTVQAQIVAYAEAIGWTVVSQEVAEQRRGFDQDVPISDRAMNRSLFLDDLFDGKILEFNPRYAEAKGVLLGQLRHVHADNQGYREFVEHLHNRSKFFEHEEKRERVLSLIDGNKTERIALGMDERAVLCPALNPRAV